MRDVFVHRDGRCESSSVGRGTRIWAFAHVLAGAVIGADCNVCDHTYVENGAVLGDGVTLKNGVQVWDGVTLESGVFVGPNATFTNVKAPRAFLKADVADFKPTLVRKRATIGANATILCGVTIGEEAFVAAGAVVTRDVVSHALVVGSPAVRVGWVCTCGWRLENELACNRCGRSFTRSSCGGLHVVD